MGLVLQFVPYSEIEELGPARRVNKLLDIAKQNKIVLLEGRLKKEEEKDLIEITMEEVNNKFKGIEMAVINQQAKEQTFFKGMKIKGGHAGLFSSWEQLQEVFHCFLEL